MNDDTKKLEEQLEKATASGNTLDNTLDAETKALREGWLALDRLIEASQPPSTQPTLVYPPEASFPAQPETAKQSLTTPKTLAAAALAASLLVAALLTWSFVAGPQDQKIVKDQQDRTQAPSPVEKEPSPVPVKPVLVNNEQQPIDTVVDELDWDAPLDNELAAAGQEMLRIQSDWYASDDTSSAIYYRMQQMQQDLSDNKL